MLGHGGIPTITVVRETSFKSLFFNFNTQLSDPGGKNGKIDILIVC